MRVLIFGAGAVGQAVGAFLGEAGHRVDLILRQRFVPVIRKHGLYVEGIFGDHQAGAESVGAFSSLGDLPDERYDVAIVTTKSYDTDEAVRALGQLDPAPDTVMSMQNGCGNVEKLAQAFGADHTLGARVITGFQIETPGRVCITVTQDAIRVGPAIPGPVPAAAETFAEALDEAGMPCVTTSNVHKELYAKLLYNCALNPLGAILGVHYGALGDVAESRRLMNRVIDEVFAVLRGLGAESHWDQAEQYREFFYENQLPATYNHRSSMLQDLQSGKRTEIEALTGYVARQGEALGIATPACAMLTDLVRFREKQKGSTEKGASTGE